MGYADKPTVGQKVEVKVAVNMPNASVKTTTGWADVNSTRAARNRDAKVAGTGGQSPARIGCATKNAGGKSL